MVKAKIGFIGSSAPSSPHLDSFRAFAPKDIDFTFVQEVNPGASLWDAQGKLDSLIGQVNDLIERHKWNGVIISGGPKEVLNAGMWERLAAEVKLPVAHGATLVRCRPESVRGRSYPADDAGG